MADPTKNKVRYALAKCAYAPATVNESTKAVTYTTPVVMPGAASIALSPEGELMIFRADGGEYVVGRDNDGYAGDLELARVPESFESDCFGATVNTDGTVTESVTDQSKPFALIFEFQGDAKAIRHCLYLCYASKLPAIDGENPDKRTVKTDKFSLRAIPRPDNGKVKHKTGDATTDTVYNGWYAAVPEFVVAG